MQRQYHINLLYLILGGCSYSNEIPKVEVMGNGRKGHGKRKLERVAVFNDAEMTDFRRKLAAHSVLRCEPLPLASRTGNERDQA